MQFSEMLHSHKNAAGVWRTGWAGRARRGGSESEREQERGDRDRPVIIGPYFG
jgi:hypothetical protein